MPGRTKEYSMPTVMPQSELLRRALQYVNDAKQDYPDKTLPQILDEAGMRFNLSPVDAEALYRLFQPDSPRESSPKA